jgi:hypothetical protein
VKKDVNLKTFSGEIRLPAGLFVCKKPNKSNVVRTPKDRRSGQKTEQPREYQTSSRLSKHGSAQKSVTFSPEVQFKSVSPKPREIILSNSPESTGCLDDLSPIANPTKSAKLDRTVETPQYSEGAKTLGTTPPQDVATATMTAFEAESDRSQAPIYEKEADTLMTTQETLDFTEQPSLRSTTQSSDPSTRASLQCLENNNKSQQSSVSFPETKRKSRFPSLILGENKQRKKSVPTKIVVQRRKNEEKHAVSAGKKTKRGRKDELDFDETENRVNSKITATASRSTLRKSRRTT